MIGALPVGCLKAAVAERGRRRSFPFPFPRRANPSNHGGFGAVLPVFKTG